MDRLDPNPLVTVVTPTYNRAGYDTEPLNLWKFVHLSDYILQQTVYFGRDALDQVGYLDETLNYSMDWDILIRIGLRYPMVYIQEYMGLPARVCGS